MRFDHGKRVNPLRRWNTAIKGLVSIKPFENPLFCKLSEILRLKTLEHNTMRVCPFHARLWRLFIRSSRNLEVSPLVARASIVRIRVRPNNIVALRNPRDPSPRTVDTGLTVDGGGTIVVKHADRTTSDERRDRVDNRCFRRARLKQCDQMRGPRISEHARCGF